MNFEWISKLISQRFGTHFGVHFRILGESREGLGSWGLASSDFDRFWIDFGTPLGAKLAPTSRPWSVLGRLDTSWGGPCVVWNPFFPISCPIPFRMPFYIDFGPQNDPKIIEKSMKNPCPHEVEKESLFPCLLQRNFKII